MFAAGILIGVCMTPPTFTSSVSRFKIDDLLEARGKSAYWLAKEIGMGHGNLWTYRKSKANTVNLGTLERICKALECEPGDILVLARDKPAPRPRAKKVKGAKAER